MWDICYGFLVVVLAHISVTSALPPCACTRDMKPVCGTDGKTYGNECSLKCKDNVEVAYRGACRAKRESCFCPMNYDPVCGSDGQTYGNRCALRCSGVSDVKAAYAGECRSKREVAAEHCLCLYNYAPVCGTDGNTYSNMCSLRCQQRYNTSLERQRFGPCSGYMETANE